MREPFNHRKTRVWMVLLLVAAAGAAGTGDSQAVTQHSGAGTAQAQIANQSRRTARRAPKAVYRATSPLGLRDPFKPPEPPPEALTGKRQGLQIPAVLPPGARGLLIDQLILEGVVDKKPDNAMIAVVTNKTNRAYFLRVNEQVFDGTVTMITPAAIYFQQHYYAQDGKAEWRTVAKRLSSGPGGKK